MTNFTPGPWTTDEDDHDQKYQDIKIKAGYRSIATVWIDDAPVQDYNAEQRANVALITAAPDLLLALSFAKSVILSGEDWTEKCEEVIQGAIKKATGIS